MELKQRRTKQIAWNLFKYKCVPFSDLLKYNLMLRSRFQIFTLPFRANHLKYCKKKMLKEHLWKSLFHWYRMQYIFMLNCSLKSFLKITEFWKKYINQSCLQNPMKFSFFFFFGKISMDFKLCHFYLMMVYLHPMSRT